MRKKLILVTETFPYGKGEKTFILPELKELVELYDITIVSHANQKILNDEEYVTKLDPRIKVINFDMSIDMRQRIKYGMRFLFDVDGWKEIVQIIKEGKQIGTRIYQSMGFYALALENYRKIVENGLIGKDESVIYYTFWSFYYTYSMTKYRNRYRNMSIITRIHGFDLYNERYAGGRQPFKSIMNSNIDKIFFISEAGKRYYEEIYGEDKETKYIVNRLGVEENRGVTKKRDVNFCLVSCSSVIPLKRVELIIYALAELTDEKIKWVHWGNGEDYSRIKELARVELGEKSNISYQFMGFGANEKVIEYYNQNYIDCFITTSSTEGLPVSIQEAMAAGIPIIATNVGGISEMIDGNGILLSESPSSEEVAGAIRRIYHMSEPEIENIRTRSYELWKERFCGEKNRGEFVQFLNELMK